MPELDTQERARLSDDDFAYIDGDGERHLPINDDDHVRNALARFRMVVFESQGSKARAARRIIAAARRRGIFVDEHDDVVRAAQG
ncbi:MAG: DUF6582 domain-containing protein [Candidatus Limnocylindrales bacterium]